MLSLCIFSRIFAIFFDASFPGKKFAVWRSAFVRYVVHRAIDSQASPYLFEQSSENHNSFFWICKRHAHVASCSQGKWLLYTKTNLPSPPTPVAHAPAWSRARDRKPVSLVRAAWLQCPVFLIDVLFPVQWPSCLLPIVSAHFRFCVKS